MKTIAKSACVTTIQSRNYCAQFSKMNYTGYKKVDEFLDSYSIKIAELYQSNLVGIYLTGSLSYGGFNYQCSDIDIITVLKNATSSSDLKMLENLHNTLESTYYDIAIRAECSYIVQDSLNVTVLTDVPPRPYYNSGIFYQEAKFGYEWLINNYLLREYGKSIWGIAPKKLLQTIDISDVQKSCFKNLEDELLPLLRDDRVELDNNYLAYTVLNLCRIFYSIVIEPTGSKTTSSSWLASSYAQDWKSLIEKAQEISNIDQNTSIILRDQVLTFGNFVWTELSNNVIGHCEAADT